MKKRLGIFVAMDNDGVIDDYILYLLDDLMQNLAHLIIVYKGSITKEGREKLQKYTTDIFICENIAQDNVAIREALTNLYGWENVRKYDELLLFNDTFYGPLFPLKIVYDKMDGKKVDFWGITDQYEMIDIDNNIIPYHIQTYFININTNMLRSHDFEMFWDDASLSFETEFTKYFHEKGYSSETFVDSSNFKVDKAKNNYSYLLYDAYNLISKYKCPIVSRRALIMPKGQALETSVCENMYETMKYIDKNTNYNTAFIWDNLLRTNNIMDIRESLNLNFIFPTSQMSEKCDLTNKKVAVVAHLYYNDLIEECFDYIKNVPSEIDVYITTSRDENISKISELFEKSNKTNYYIRKVPNRGRDTAALLIGCKDILTKYEYLCFVHDKKTTGNNGPVKMGNTFRYILWENSLKSKEYILNVINEFEKTPKLGVLSTPAPYHSHYINCLYHRWSEDFEETYQLKQRMGINCNMSKDKSCPDVGTTFWCRTDALIPLFTLDLKLEDFPIEPAAVDGTIMHGIERVIPFVAQARGYFSGVMQNIEFASTHISSIEYILMNTIKKSRMNTFASISDGVQLNSFCEKYSNIYIYGAGFWGKETASYLDEIEIKFNGFVVSEGQSKKDEVMGRNVFYLSQIDYDPNDCGLIVAVSSDKQGELSSILRGNGYQNLHLIGYLLDFGNRNA